MLRAIQTSARLACTLRNSGVRRHQLGRPTNSATTTPSLPSSGVGSVGAAGYAGLSRKERDRFDGLKYRTSGSKYDPFYSLTTTDARWGLSEVWPLGVDPPQPFLPIDVKGRSKVAGTQFESLQICR